MGKGEGINNDEDEEDGEYIDDGEGINKDEEDGEGL